jgi:hypothetical protein
VRSSSRASWAARLDGADTDPTTGTPATIAFCAISNPQRQLTSSTTCLIRQVYEVDPLLCPCCGGTMKILAVIERPAIIRQFLAHLGLPAVAPSLRAPSDPPDGSSADLSREWSYEPLSDDLPVLDPMHG